MVEERPVGHARLTRVKLDPRAAGLDTRRARRTGRRRAEPERAVLARGLFRALREERDMVEVVLDVGLGLDEPEAHALGADVEVAIRVASALDVEAGRECAKRGVETRDAEGDVLQGAAFARAFGVEERD